MTARLAHRWTCTNCMLEIHHHPTFHVGLAFCCAGCVAGGPCTCSYDDDVPSTEPPVGAAQDVEWRIGELAGVD